MKRVVAWLVAASMGLGAVACGSQGDGSSGDETSGAMVGGGCARDARPTLTSRLGEAAVALTTDPAAIPVGAQNPYFTSLQLEKGGSGKFSAKLNDGSLMEGTYTTSVPRCLGVTDHELLSLEPPAGTELTFEVSRDNSSGYRFVGNGFTPFNMKLGVAETPVAGGCSDPKKDCKHLGRPRCIGAGEFECVSNQCEWVWANGKGCGP